MAQAKEQAGGLDNWADVLEAHEPGGSAKGILMLRAAAKTLRALAADAPEGSTGTVYLVFVEEVEWSEVVGVFSSPEAAAECKDWVVAQLARTTDRDDKKVCIKLWVVGGSTHRGMWRAWIDLEGKASGDPVYEPSGSVIESYQMRRNDKPCGWAVTSETVDDAYALARKALNRLKGDKE